MHRKKNDQDMIRTIMQKSNDNTIFIKKIQGYYAVKSFSLCHKKSPYTFMIDMLFKNAEIV